MEDRRSAGESSCNSGGGTDQRVESLILMMMMMMMMMMLILLVELLAELVHGMKNSQYTKRFASYKHNKWFKIDINEYNKIRGVKQISPITQEKKTQNPLRKQTNKQTKRDRTTCRAGSRTKFVISTHFIHKMINLFNYISLFDMCLFDVKKIHEDNLRTIETCRSFDGLYVKLYIILNYSAYNFACYFLWV